MKKFLSADLIIMPMVKRKHLKLLSQGIDTWNKWIKAKQLHNNLDPKPSAIWDLTI
jgi:hypothetical protein